MNSGAHLINLSGIASIATIISLVIALLAKMERLKQAYTQINNLKKSLDEMDEQAKLIVRTDLELNKTQEELDKKIAGLYALQRLSRTISTTLQEEQIFKTVQGSHLEDMGFERACVFLWNERGKAFTTKMHLGYSEDEIEQIKSATDLQETYLNLIKNEKTISSSYLQDEPMLRDQIKAVFKVNSFVISPVLPKEGYRGILFVGTESMDTVISEGDEELITILANQLGQALENARLFEQTWRAQQDLEKRVEERTHELTEIVEELKRVSKRKGDFVSSVSHELRTPLTSIKGYASILLSKGLGEIPEAIKQRLERINQHSDELVHMINDLLDIGRLESGRVLMKTEPCNLKEIAQAALDLLSVQIKEKDLLISLDIPSEVKVNVERAQIQRVFINLISNAIKFTPQNGKISLNTKSVRNFIQVNISDTGIGIPPEEKERIFEEFYRVDNPINEKIKGTGLGLSLVKSIVEVHKGAIWVESSPGAGSTFSFLLPTAN
jgi:signal transduction histidine kinase